MVELSIIDSSTVTTPSGSITGPVRCYVGSVTVGPDSFTMGHVQVVAGTATQPFGSLTAQQADLLPFALWFSFWICGRLFQKLFFP